MKVVILDRVGRAIVLVTDGVHRNDAHDFALLDHLGFRACLNGNLTALVRNDNLAGSFDGDTSKVRRSRGGGDADIRGDDYEVLLAARGGIAGCSAVQFYDEAVGSSIEVRGRVAM